MINAEPNHLLELAHLNSRFKERFRPGFGEK
jgi:hypothetical protein